MGVGQREIHGLARRILGRRDQRRNAAARLVLAAYEVTGALGATMPTSTPAGGRIWPKRMLKPWAKKRALPSKKIRLDIGLVDALLLGVGQQDHDQVGLCGRLAIGSTRRPAASAFAFDDEPSRRPTRTSMPSP